MPINLGAALGGLTSGYANQANTAWEQQQKQQALIRQQQQQAALYQALQGMQGQPQSPMPAPGGQPPQPGVGQPPSPLAKPGGDTAVLAALGSSQQPSSPQAQPPAMSGTSSPSPRPTGTPPQMQQPNDRMSQIIASVAGLKIPDWQKGAVLEQAGAFITPFEKMQMQLEGAQQKLSMQQQMLDERLNTMVQIRQMANAQSGANTQARVGATERGQDIRADTAESEQKIQQQRADTGQAAQQSRAIQGEEGLKIKQQQADTSQDRAGTYKYSTMQKEKLAERKQGETEKLDAAKIKKMETATSAENKKPFQAARDQYNRAASLYQSLTRPGATPAASPDDISFAKQKMDDAAAKMESLTGGGSSPTALVKPNPGEEVRTDGKGNYFVLRDGKPAPAEPPAGQ